MTDPRLVRPSWRGRTNVDALTIACIEHAEDLTASYAPVVAHEFVVTQGSYQDTVEASAGTHNLGGVVDLVWCDHSECLYALRMAGMAAWHRTPAQGPWRDHVHAVVIGHPYLAPAAARQVTAYLSGRNGLANNGPDDGPRLDPIPRPVWPYPQEDDMPPYRDWPAKDREALVADVVAGILAAPVNDKTTVRKALALASRANEVTRAQAAKTRGAVAALADALTGKEKS